MKHKGIVTLGLILITAFAVGVLWATDTSAPVAATPEPATLPTEKAPADLPGNDTPPVEAVGFCANATPCPTIPCGHEGCTYEITACSSVDLGVPCCVDNGQVFSCGPGETVHRQICDCETDCIHLPLSKSNFCQ